MAQKSNHYVDNKRLQREFEEYVEKRDTAIANGETPPQVPDYIAWALIQIAKHTATRYNFRNYTYNDEMIGDGIEAAIKKVDNFDPKNPKANPFGYFSLVIWRVFASRIKREQRQSRIKQKMLKNASANIEEYVENAEGLDTNLFNEIQEEALSHWDKGKENKDRS